MVRKLCLSTLLSTAALFILFAWTVAALAADEPTTVSAEVAQKALDYAERYADVQYRAQGQERTGVAFMWGGRMGVEEYLQAVASGKTPSDEAGADASAVVVNAYLAADPGHRFAVVWNGERRLWADATSDALFRWNVRRIPAADLRPGDLIFFQNQDGDVSGVAIFSRREGPNVHFIVASARAGKVIRTFLNVDHAYWQSSFKAAGRLLDTGP